MRRAKLIVAGAWVICPACAAEIPEPFSGSLMWQASQLTGTVTCPDCGTPLTLTGKVTQ